MSAGTPPPTPADRLVACARELLAAEGVGAVTLRSIARAAQVSHGAPLRHFPHRAALLSAVAVTGFRDLIDRCEQAQRADDGDGATRLRAAALAYAAMASEQPGMFSLMFRHDLLDPADKELTAASLAAYGRMVDAVRARQAEGWRQDEDPLLLTGAFWAALHGFVQLWTWGSFAIATRTPSRQDALDAVLRVFDLEPLPPPQEP